MAIKLGLDMKLFYGPTAGTTATVEMTNVKDVTLTLSTGEADVTTRAADGWRLTVATLKEGEVGFTMLWDTADEGFKAIKNAWLNNTPIPLFVTDGAGTGLDADFSVTNFTFNQQLEEAGSVDVTCKPTASGRAPAWVDAVASSSSAG